MQYQRIGIRGLAVVIGIRILVSPAAAHSGTTHAGTPHVVLLVLFISGVAAIVGAVAAMRREFLSVQLAAVALAGGAITAVFGGIGLVELQVVAETPPRLVELYPTLSLLVAGGLGIGGLVIGRLKWPRKPQFAVLCQILAAWIVYPIVMPNQGYYNPIGYLLVLSLPVLLAYIIWTDGRGVLQSLRLQPTPKIAGIGAGLLMSVFFAFSAGTMSVNPDQGVNMPTEAFIVPYQVAGPLVVWPAIEWYFPSIPFSGYLSLGTILMMGVLGGLVGLNVAVVVQQGIGGESTAGKPLFSGSLAVSGATACCCCAPAFYGVLSVLFGGAVTPVYWSFMISTSPVSGAFLAASILLLLGSFLQSSGESATDLNRSVQTS